MYWKWIDEIESGVFRTELCPLKLFNEKVTYEGQGTFEWSVGSSAEIEAFTDGGEDVFRNLVNAMNECKFGEILPDSAYLRCLGETRDGWTVKINRIAPEFSSSHGGHPTVVWQIPNRGIYSSVEIEKPNDDDVTNQTLALLGPVQIPHWPRSSITEYTNPRFGTTSQQRDWLEIETDRATIVCQRRDNSCIRVGFIHKHPDFDRTITAFRSALAFVTGRVVNVIAAESFSTERVHRHLKWDQKPVRSNGFATLLGVGAPLANLEHLLTTATDYFASERDQYVSNMLHACIDSADNSFTTQSMVLGVATEGLMKRLCNESKMKVSTRLKAWSERDVLGIDSQDEVAWRELRNISAHGDFLLSERDDMQKRVTQMRRLKNLLVKVFLQFMDYDGEFFNYQTGKQEPFPRAVASQFAG